MRDEHCERQALATSASGISTPSRACTTDENEQEDKMSVKSSRSQSDPLLLDEHEHAPCETRVQCSCTCTTGEGHGGCPSVVGIQGNGHGHGGCPLGERVAACHTGDGPSNATSKQATMYLAASESCAFASIGGQLIREVALWLCF